MFRLHFRKARYWVDCKWLVAYIVWSHQVSRRCGRFDYRSFLRQLWCPVPVRRVPEALEDAFLRSRRLGVEPSWVRYPTDGTRLQVFDANKREICKVVLGGGQACPLAVELSVRRKMGSLAPEILAVDENDSAYVEVWVEAAQAAYSSRVMEIALRGLANGLYDIQWIDRDQFRESVSRYGPITEEMSQGIRCAFANLGPVQRVPWSQVHGDLVEANVLITRGDKVILIDWEYTRKCIVTYDCWLYQYSHEQALGRIDVPSLCRRFNCAVKDAFGTNLGDINPCSLHLLHLIERIRYLEYVSPQTTDVIRQTMVGDMRKACGQLAGVYQCT